MNTLQHLGGYLLPASIFAAAVALLAALLWLLTLPIRRARRVHHTHPNWIALLVWLSVPLPPLWLIAMIWSGVPPAMGPTGRGGGFRVPIRPGRRRAAGQLPLPEPAYSMDDEMFFAP